MNPAPDPRRNTRSNRPAFPETHPELLPEWDTFRNGSLSPWQVTTSSGKPSFWLCPAHGHPYTSSAAKRTRGRGCSICRGLSILLGVNDLASQDKQLAKQWDDLRNGDLQPIQVTISSGKKAWWLCPEYGHSWDAPVAMRTRGHGCRVCAGLQVEAGFNDLASQDPVLTADWDCVANGNLLPTMVTRHSMREIAWLSVLCGHRWRCTVKSRRRGAGCPECRKAQTSRPEAALFRALEPFLAESQQGARVPLVWSAKQKSATLDVSGEFMGLKVAVEYDGVYFHDRPARVVTDLSKTQALLVDGWLVVRVRENRLSYLPFVDPRLLQISHPYKFGSDAEMDAMLAPTAATIVTWLSAANSSHCKAA